MGQSSSGGAARECLTAGMACLAVAVALAVGMGLLYSHVRPMKEALGEILARGDDLRALSIEQLARRLATDEETTRRVQQDLREVAQLDAAAEQEWATRWDEQPVYYAFLSVVSHVAAFAPPRLLHRRLHGKVGFLPGYVEIAVLLLSAAALLVWRSRLRGRP